MEKILYYMNLIALFIFSAIILVIICHYIKKYDNKRLTYTIVDDLKHDEIHLKPIYNKGIKKYYNISIILKILLVLVFLLTLFLIPFVL